MMKARIAGVRSLTAISRPRAEARYAAIIFSRSSTELISSCFICSANCCSLVFRSAMNFCWSGVLANAAARSSEVEIFVPATELIIVPAIAPTGPPNSSAFATKGAAFFRNPRTFAMSPPLLINLVEHSTDEQHQAENDNSRARENSVHALPDRDRKNQSANDAQQ